MLSYFLRFNQMQFTDSHIHLQDYKEKNTQQIIADLRQYSFFKVITVSSEEKDFTKVLNLYKAAPDLIVPSFGIHPWYIQNLQQGWQERLKNLLLKYPQSIIGECGIDRQKTIDIKYQTDVLSFQLKLANELQRPINLHLVKAEDIWAELSKKLKTKFMLHSFSGSEQFLCNMLKKGAYISLNPSLLKRKNFNAIARLVPDDKLLVESDAPYQSSPEDTVDFIKLLATARNANFIELNNQITNNLLNFIK